MVGVCCRHVKIKAQETKTLLHESLGLQLSTLELFYKCCYFKSSVYFYVLYL